MHFARDGCPTWDVYDAVAWSVVSELSEMSVANKSRPRPIFPILQGEDGKPMRKFTWWTFHINEI